MDPNACLQRALDADTLEELREALEDLRDWMDKGGFAPVRRQGSRLVRVAVKRLPAALDEVCFVLFDLNGNKVGTASQDDLKTLTSSKE